MAIDIKKILGISADLDDKSSAALVNAIKENYIKEFDYIKFIHSVQNLLKLGMDKETAYKSAYTTAQSMGFTSNKFEDSVRHYQKVLSQERERFAEALKRQRSEKISDRLSDKEKIQERIKKNLAEIEKLQKENQILKERYEKFEETLRAEKEKLEMITEKFVDSFQHISEKIENDKKLFNLYIN